MSLPNLMSKLLKWVDEHIIEYLSFALLILIPLYPKIPIADILPGYIVRIRFDDLLVGFAFGIWLIWLLRKKVTLKGNPLFVPILIYVVVGLLSSLSAIFITKTVPMDEIHIGKLLLHWARRVEYFSVFFIFFSSIKSLSDIKKYVYIAAIVLLAVSIYGFGQKYLIWPAYSTMNREFSKGITLVIGPNGRVLSTFGGHYDLAAYLMIVLTLFIPLGMIVKNSLHKALFLFVSICGFWLMILTVSRTSFLAYLVSITVAFAMLVPKKGIIWSASRWFVVLSISLTIMLFFGDLSDRFAHVLKVDSLKSTLLGPIVKMPSSDTNTAYLEVGSKSDTPPSIADQAGKQDTAKPSDVIEDIPLDGRDGAAATLAARPRVYSQNAIQYDLSTGIRLDYTWPKAIEGFTRNPLLGSGYSTLTKEHIEVFTEAESTDNDFLRALGETGILGFLTFYGIIAVVCFQVIRSFKEIKDIFSATIVTSIFAGVIGLLVNAFYIDVFEASKVAYTFWMMVAITLATIKISTTKTTKSEKA